MSLVKDVIQLSAFAWFMRDGDAFTLPAPGIAARESKPSGADPAYIELGLIQDWDPDYSGGQDLDVWRPSPGHLELYEMREIKARLNLKITGGELSPLALEIFYRASQKMDETTSQFNPGTAALRTGWCHIQAYDQKTDVLKLTMDLYGRIKITSLGKTGDGSIMKPTWEFLKLYSTQNTAGL